MSFHFSMDHVRVLFKAKQHGMESLDEDERALYDEFVTGAREAWARQSPEQLEELQRGFDLYERLSPADQMRYGDWTPRQLLAFLPLLDLDLEDE